MDRACGLAFLVALASCSDHPSGAAPPADETSTLLARVVEDLLVEPKFKTYPAWSARPKVVVSDRTRGPSPFLSSAQLSGELDDAPTWGLDLAGTLADRNADAVSIPTSAFPNPRVLLIPDADLQAIRGLRQEFRSDSFEERFPDAKAYVMFWRPALSPDGKRAIVRFAFGPTAHGACGTYLLEREAAGWIIRHRDFAYYA